MGMNVVAKIRQATRRKYTAEEKIRIVLEGLRGEIAISELCRREGTAPTMYYRWSKAFLDTGKNGLTRDTQRDATTDEVRALKDENATLKKALAESALETMKYKKAWACRASSIRPHERREEAGDLAQRRGVRGSGHRCAGEDGYLSVHVLPVAEAVPHGWAGIPSRPQASSGAELEPTVARGAGEGLEPRSSGGLVFNDSFGYFSPVHIGSLHSEIHGAGIAAKNY